MISLKIFALKFIQIYNVFLIKQGGEMEPSEIDKTKPYAIIYSSECKGCERCVLACPKNSLKMSKSTNERGYYYAEFSGSCTGCANCYYTCPEPSAIEVHIPKKT